MATSGIDIGDAVLTFLADTTQIDQALARVNAEVPGKLKPAGEAVTKISDGFTAVGKSAGAAATQAKAAGSKFVAAGEEIKGVLGEAKDTSVLLGEAIGVRLPRSVGRFVAELPGIGTALNAAFSSIAVIFLIQAIVQAAAKIDEFLDKPQKIADAWSQYGQTVFTTGEHIRGEIDKEEQKLIEMTQGPVAALDFALRHLQTTAFETFKSLTSDITDAVKVMKEQSSFTNVFGDAAKDLEHFSVELQKAMRVAQQTHPEDPLIAYKTGIEAVQAKERELTGLISKRTAASGADASAAIDGLHAERQAVNDLLPVLKQGLELDQLRLKVAKDDTRVAAAQQQAAQAKRDLDQELAAIEERKAKAHAAYLDGQTDIALWRKAELDAVAATTGAHELYNRKLVTIYTQSGEVIKRQAAAQDLATLTTKDSADAWERLNEATQKHREAVQAVLKDWLNLQAANVGKDFREASRAADELVRSELRLADAQKNLALAKVAQDFGPQEAAIQRLANFGVITEEQKAERLRVLYQQEEVAALAALQQLQEKERIAVAAAQARLDQAKGSPFISQADIDGLTRTLQELQRAYENTQSEITQAQTKFSQQRIEQSRGELKEAVAIALASGQRQLAASLELKQAQLDQIDLEIRLAKARGDDTAALEKLRKATQAQTHDLVNETRATQGLNRSLTEVKNTFKQAAQDELHAFGTAMQAALAGQQSFGAAMEAGTLRVIGSLAQKWADYYFALAIADLFWNPARAAGEFAAAIALEAVVAGTGALAGSIENKGGSSSSGGTSQPIDQSLPSNQPEQQPVQQVNVQHFASGALVSKQTLALVGDSRRGGNARAGILPLDDPAAMDAIAGEIAKRIGARGGDTYNHYNFNIRDLATADGLAKFTKKITREVNRGAARLSSSNSLRVTKRG